MLGDSGFLGKAGFYLGKGSLFAAQILRKLLELVRATTAGEKKLPSPVSYSFLGSCVIGTHIRIRALINTLVRSSIDI